MVIQGEFDAYRRIEAVTDDDSDGRERRGRKKVLYQGRSWKEKEEDLPLQVQVATLEENRKNFVYADHFILEKAEKLLEQYTTLEDKIAGLLFYEIEAFYDEEMQRSVQLLIQEWKVGGLIFAKGDCKRQLYLSEYYQKLASLFLLMGNDFSHGLSFYFQGELSEEMLSVNDTFSKEKYFGDLGKAVVSLNRRLGVHIQMAQHGKNNQLPMAIEKEHIQAFRKGIRDAHGIVGVRIAQENKIALSNKYAYPIFLGKQKVGTTALQENEVRGVFGLKKIDFLDLTLMPDWEVEQEFLNLFSQNSADGLLLPLHKKELFPLLVAVAREKKIDEKILEKKLLKILAIKSFFLLENHS